ncbi:MAG: DUF1501 domain-containing protein [Burkholderiales bacterium]|nr:DUF1501 domain-containing protein [Opitutaceae bacterium]
MLLASAQAVPGSEYRALVCLFLNGGNDSFNMLAPRGVAEHAEYAAVRQDLAIPAANFLPINPLNSAQVGRQLGVHPGMPELAQLFEDGNAAFVANVGTLVEPGVTKAGFASGLAKLPVGLFSHSDQIEQWQTSLPDTRSGIGWAGRAADLLNAQNAHPAVSMNISLAGSNVWQTGNSVFEYAITPDGAVGLTGYSKEWVQEYGTRQIRSAAVDGQLAMEYANVFQRTFAGSQRSALDAYDLFSGATSGSLPVGANFPSSNLGGQLQMIARTIAGRDALGAQRQTFFVSLGGWDHHDEVLVNQANMLPVVSQAVGAFYHALELLGIQNNVTLFLASDFGRTLSSNGRGSDHAWGGNTFVVGGAVDGKKIYGAYPDLYADNPLDVGRGRLIPTTSVDSYFAELALWLGVPRASLPLVLPNIGRFYDTAGSGAPVGFLPV